MSVTTHATVCAQQLVCMHVVHVSLAKEIPAAFRSHAPPLVAGVVEPDVPLELPVGVVSGSGPSCCGDDVECFEAHAARNADRTRPTLHDTRSKERMHPRQARHVPLRSRCFFARGAPAHGSRAHQRDRALPWSTVAVGIFRAQRTPWIARTSPSIGVISCHECACASVSSSLPR